MGLFSGLSNYLFGSDRVQDQQTKQQAFNEQNIAAQYRAREAQDYAKQIALSQYLNRVISGNAPSVAGTQLEQGLDQASRAGMSQAAGGTGTNAGLNQYGAIQNTGNLMAQTNQAAALARAQEQAQAVQNQTGLLGGMAGRSAALGATNGNLGLDYSQLLTKQQELNQAQGNRENAALLQGIGSGGATLLAR